MIGASMASKLHRADSDSASLGSNPSSPASQNIEKSTFSDGGQDGPQGTERARRTDISRHSPRTVERIFVFGSNHAGRHGKGAALWAVKNRGAIYGVPEGLQGMSYAIPTKDRNLRTLPIRDIEAGVRRFLAYAASMPFMRFQLTPIGCGLAGYKYADIGPLFAGAPPNVDIPPEFAAYLRPSLSDIAEGV